MPFQARYAGVVELVDAPDSKSGSARSVGSSPTTRTRHLAGTEAKMRRFLATALLSLLVTAPALAETSVTDGQVKDVSPLVWRSVNERDALFRHLARTLTTLGDRDLPPGRNLAVELIDVRPAGQFEPWRATADNVRILRDTTPPSVKLRYRLADGKRVVASGEETVTDMNYLWDVAARSSFGSFPYETELMRDWFRDRVLRLKPQPR